MPINPVDSNEHLNNIPITKNEDNNELPPLLTKGKGKPVVGIVPVTTAICIID